MARFTISRHSGAPDGKDHFDLFLEKGATLKSWRLRDSDFSEAAPASEAPDHDLKYLAFEGALTGGKGSVAVVETGTWLEDSWTAHGIQAALTGRKLRKRIWLHPKAGAKDEWKWSVEDASLATRRLTAALLREPAPEPPPSRELESAATELDEEERVIVMLADQFMKAAPVEWSRVKTDGELRSRIGSALARWRHPWLLAAEKRGKIVDELAKSITPSREAPVPKKS